MKCKYCKKNEAIKYSKYSSGEFCSKSCAAGFSTKAKRKEINAKVSKILTGYKYVRTKISHGKKPKICPVCLETFYVYNSSKQICCSRVCNGKNPAYKEKVSINMKNFCSSPEQKNRLRNIGRKGGFGKKGYTKNNIYFQSALEEKCFNLLESCSIPFEPHKNIINSSKVSDIYLPTIDLWIELDGIDREKRKNWLGKDYDYWLNKLEIYKRENLNFVICKTFKEFKELLNDRFIT